jgi:hypothetical protein
MLKSRREDDTNLVKNSPNEAKRVYAFCYFVPPVRGFLLRLPTYSTRVRVNRFRILLFRCRVFRLETKSSASTSADSMPPSLPILSRFFKLSSDVVHIFCTFLSETDAPQLIPCPEVKKEEKEKQKY